MPWTCPSCQQENPGTSHFCAGCGAPNPQEPGPVASPQATAERPPAHPAPPPPKAGGGKKWLLFGVLAVLLLFCCIAAGIVAAIAVPNFLSAAEKTKQKTAVTEVKALADALLAYAQDNGGLYPDTGHKEGMYYTTVSADQLAPFLVPKYIATIPAKDPWEGSYEYGVSPGDDAFVVLCGGSDKTVALEAIPEAPVETHCFEDDILWENDRFLQTPGGEQKRCK